MRPWPRTRSCLRNRAQARRPMRRETLNRFQQAWRRRAALVCFMSASATWRMAARIFDRWYRTSRWMTSAAEVRSACIRRRRRRARTTRRSKPRLRVSICACGSGRKKVYEPQMNGWMDGWMDEWMDRWVGG
mgnify:CR=1 FL=1